MREDVAYYWTYIDPVSRRRVKTRFMCDESHANRKAADGEWLDPCPIGPARVLMVPETDVEMAKVYREYSTGAFLNHPKR